MLISIKTFIDLFFLKGYLLMNEEEIQADQAQAEAPMPSNEEQFDAIMNELDQAQASLEGDVAKALAQQTDADLEELFFEDKEAFYKEVFKMQNEYLEANINPKIAQAKELQGKMQQEQDFQAIDRAKEQFAQAHPDVDIEALMQFYTTLDEQTQAELGSLPPLEFFEALLQLFQGQEQGQAGGEHLPTQIQGVEGNASLGDESLPMDRF